MWNTALYVPRPEVKAYSGVMPVLGFAILIAGMILCYRANARGDDRDFISRFICLTWPLGIQIFVCSIPIVFAGMFVATVTAAMLELPEKTAETLKHVFVAGLWLLITLWYYFRLYSYIGHIARKGSGTVQSRQRPEAVLGVPGNGT